MPTCRIGADSDQELRTEEVAEASPRSLSEGVAPAMQNSRRLQKQASTSFGRTSESQPLSFKNIVLQVSKSTNVSN